MQQNRHFQRISRMFSICMVFLLLFGTISACVSKPVSDVPETPLETAISVEASQEESQAPEESEQNELEPLVFDFSQAAPLEASKQGRTEANSRMFDALKADNSFGRFAFEINDDFGTAEIEALYEDLYTKVVEFLKTFPIQLYEKPEIVFVGYTDEPGFYKQHARIPYSMVKQGDVDKFILRAFLTQSEPWLSYGVADYLFAEPKTVDLSLMEDTETLYLTGMSFELPYVTEAERDNAIALAGSFVRYIIEEHGEEAISPLFNGNSTLDIYAMIQDWSGTSNSFFEAHPEVLDGSLSYYDIESYDVKVDDGAFEIYFRLRDVEPASGLDSPVKLYGFVNRIQSAAKQISDFANEHDIPVINRGIRAYTDTDTVFYFSRSAQAGPSEVVFSSNFGWSTAVEHELVHVMFGRKVGEDGPNLPMASEGLTTLLSDYLIFDHRDIFEMGGIPDRSFYNNLMWLKAGEFDESDLIYADELEAGQKVVECYEQFASLDKGESQFDYALYIDSLAYVWLIHCNKTGEAVEDMFGKDLARSSESSPLAYYAGASYHNYLINQKDYSVKDLLDAYYGDIPIEDYTAEWVAWIRGKFNAVENK